MKKTIALLLIMMAMAGTLTACQRSDVVAVVGKTNITASEALPVYDFLYKQMVYMNLLYYGVEITPETPNYKDFVTTVKTQTLNLMAENVAMEQKLDELGLSLTEEELNEIETVVNEEYEQYVESFITTGEEDTEEAKAAAEEAARQEVDNLGFSLEALRYLMHGEEVEAKLKEAVAANVTVNEEEIQAKYEELRAAQEERYAGTPSLFATDVLNGSTIYTRPEGYRYVKNIVIGFSDEINTQITAKNTELTAARSTLTTAQSQLAADPAPTGDEKAALETQMEESQALVTRLEEEMEALRAQGREEVRAHAEEVLALCRADGADFDALLTEYSVDQPTNQTILDHGYPVSAASTNYVQSFTDGAMAIANVGDVSDLIESQYGFHILLYTGDVEAGAVPLDEVRETVSAQVQTAKEDEVFSAQKSYWLDQANIKVYTSRLSVD